MPSTDDGTIDLDQLSLDQIAKEPQTFHDYLLFFKCDVDQARAVIQIEVCATVISLSKLSVDTVALAPMKGDFNFFLQQLPADNNCERIALLGNKVEDYKDLLGTLLARADPDGDCSISHEELRVMFETWQTACQ